MKTETSEDQNAEPQESPQEPPLQTEVPPLPTEVPQEPADQAAVPQEIPPRDVVPQDSTLQDTGLQKPPLQDAGLHESSPSKEMLTDVTSPDGRGPISRISRIRLDSIAVEIDTPRPVGTPSSSVILQVLQQENKNKRLQETCQRLRAREAESERKIQEELELSCQVSAEKRMLSSTNSEEKRKLSSQISMDKQRASSLISEDKRKEKDILQTKLGEDIESRSLGSSTTSKSFPSAMAPSPYTDEDVMHASFSSLVSVFTEQDNEDLDSEDVMRTAVDELMLVPSISNLSLSEDRVLVPSISTRSMKSIKSSKSTKSVLSVPGVTVSEPDSSESESEDSSEEEPAYTPPKPEDEASEPSSELEAPRASDFVETPFTDMQPIDHRPPTIDFDEFLAAHQGKEGPTAAELQAIQKGIEARRIIQDFLNAMIRKVIGDFDPYQFCRNQLDKQKLLTGLLDQVKEHIELMSVNQELNDQLVEYFRRTKNTRSFIELPEEETEAYRRRYKAGLNYLGYGQNRVALIKAKVGRLITRAQLELSNVMHIALGTEQHLEQTMRRVVIRPDSESDLLKRFVARELRLMDEHRNQISDTRFQLITQTHDLGKFKEQIKRLETLSENVSMNDFITLQTKVITMEKKIEERNLELRRLRSQYHTELHLTKHNREKALALRNRIESLREQLVEKNMVRKGLKDKLYHVKLEKKKIRVQSSELAYQGGILSMPTLMYDYDRTIVYIREKQERILGLKETMRSISQHIESVWAQISTKSITQM